MKRIFFAVVLGLSFLMSQTVVNAQSYEGYGYRAPQAQFYSGPVNYYPNYGWNGYGYGHHASTYEQGVLTGLGQLYQGVGQYNVSNSIAAYNWQVARSAYLQNNTAEFLGRQSLYANVKVAQARKAEENKKKNASQAKFNAARPIERLTSKELDRSTGSAAWPTVLTDAKFDSNRGMVQSALNQKFNNQQVSTSASDDMLLSSIGELLQKLEDSKEDYRAQDYYAAKNFLTKMKQEASQSIPEGRLAASF
jgi:hypothetical protein